MDEPMMTDGQRRALFAASRAHGMDRNALRAMTPVGSISALTFAQASDLLTRLNAGTPHAHPRKTPRGPRRPAGVYAIATAAQRRKIEALRIELGWTAAGLESWLSERSHVDGRPMTRVDSTRDASAVIELLKAVVSRTVHSREVGESETPPCRGADQAPTFEGNSIGVQTPVEV